MNTSWSFFDAITGLFCPGRISIPSTDDPARSAPAGHTPKAGNFDCLSQRVDLTTGAVVPYQPPQPPFDEMRAWTWDATTKRWVSSPTTVALAKIAREQRSALLLACDWTQAVDSPLTALQRAAWVTYRIALRTVPQQAGFPAQIAWPVPPA